MTWVIGAGLAIGIVWWVVYSLSWGEVTIPLEPRRLTVSIDSSLRKGTFIVLAAALLMFTVWLTVETANGDTAPARPSTTTTERLG